MATEVLECDSASMPWRAKQIARAAGCLGSTLPSFWILGQLIIDILCISLNVRSNCRNDQIRSSSFESTLLAAIRCADNMQSTLVYPRCLQRKNWKLAKSTFMLITTSQSKLNLRAASWSKTTRTNRKL